MGYGRCVTVMVGSNTDTVMMSSNTERREEKKGWVADGEVLGALMAYRSTTCGQAKAPESYSAYHFSPLHSTGQEPHPC